MAFIIPAKLFRTTSLFEQEILKIEYLKSRNLKDLQLKCTFYILYFSTFSRYPDRDQFQS